MHMWQIYNIYATTSTSLVVGCRDILTNVSPNHLRGRMRGGGNCVGGTDGVEIVKLGSTFGAAVQWGSLTVHCNKVFSLRICGLVLDCVCGVVGSSDMIGLHCALKCTVGAI